MKQMRINKRKWDIIFQHTSVSAILHGTTMHEYSIHKT